MILYPLFYVAFGATVFKLIKQIILKSSLEISQIHHIHKFYLGHEFETPFYPGEGLLVQDAGLIGRHNSWVDEAQEHGAAHRTNAVLWEPLTHHLCGGGWREQGERDEGKTKGGNVEQMEQKRKV